MNLEEYFDVEKQIIYCEGILACLRFELREKDIDGMAIHLKGLKIALLDLEDALRKIDENIDVV